MTQRHLFARNCGAESRHCFVTVFTSGSSSRGSDDPLYLIVSGRFSTEGYSERTKPVRRPVFL